MSDEASPSPADLERALSREAEAAGDDEAPALLARLAAVRLDDLNDTGGALAAAARCLSLDPGNEPAKVLLQRLLADSDRRLAAADVLETLHEGKDPAGLLRVHETRAELLEHPAARLASLSAAVDLAAGPLGDPARARALARRALGQALASAPEQVPAWIERLERLAHGDATARAALADELLAAGADATGDAEAALERARALALAGVPGREDDASAAFRALIARLGDEADLRAFEAFFEARADEAGRTGDRRWLLAFRVERASDPADALRAWARAEEVSGDHEAALAVYRRLASGDGGRAVLAPAQRLAVDLQITRLLLGALRSPAEAAATLAPWIGARPAEAEVQELARRLLLDPAGGSAAAACLDQVAGEAEPARSFHAFVDLSIAAEGAAALVSERRRWFERLLERSAVDPAAGLAAALRGCAQFPDATPLWEGTEQLARTLRAPEAVTRACEDVLLSDASLPAPAAEAIGRRMVALQTEYAIASDRSFPALERLLVLAPGARWALERAKVTLGSEGRWEELFRVYDRAVDSAEADAERAEWLREAAFAARDLAGQPERALGYLWRLHASAPDDLAVEAALERLCERLARKSELVDLLERRAGRAAGFHRRELRRRIASLRLDLGDADRAHAAVVQMLEADGRLADVVDLLERVLGSAPSPDVEAEAVARLRAHYETLGPERVADVIRVTRRSLALAGDARARSRVVRDLVALRLRAADSAGDAHPPLPVLSSIEEDAAGDPALERVAYRAVLAAALRAMRDPGPRTPPAPSRGTAAERAWEALHRLVATRARAGETRAAFQLLRRGARLPFEGVRRRELLAAAATMSADVLSEAAPAIALFERLFADDPGDGVAAASLAKFAALLEASGERDKLAGIWEQQGRVQTMAGHRAEARACWERAGALWQRQGEIERALAAHHQAAALGSSEGMAAIARLRMERGEWADAARALEWLLPRSAGPARAGVALRLAEAFAQLGRRDLARARLEEAAADAPEPELGALRARLLSIYREEEAWEALAGLLTAEAHRVAGPDDKLAFLREAAVIQASRLGRPDRAAELLELALPLAPADGRLRASLVDLLEKIGRWDRAAGLLRVEAAEASERPPAEGAAVHLRLARALARAGAPGDALAELRVAERLRPGHPVVVWELARACLEAGELDDAERAFRAVLLSWRPAEPPRASGEAAQVERVPATRAAVILDLSEVAARRGEVERAADLVESALDAAAEHGDEPAPLEATLRSRGRLAGLTRALERRAERGATLPERAAALSELAALWARGGRDPERGARLRRHTEGLAQDLAREESPAVSAWIGLAGAAAALREPGAATGPDDLEPRAVAAVTRAIEAHPGLGEAADWLGQRLGRDGRLAELVAMREQRARGLAAEGAPAADRARASFELGHARELLGQPEEAAAAYEAAVDAGPNEREILRTIADRLERLGSGRLADALELLLAVDPSAGISAALRLLALRERQADAEGTSRALVLAFSLDPARVEIRDRLVAAHEGRGEWSEAASLLRRAVAVTPGDRALVKHVADAYRKVPDETEALRVLDGAIARHPGDAELLALRAPVRERLGDGEGAAADLEAAALADARYLTPFAELLSRLAEEADPALADGQLLRLVDLLVRVNRPKQARRELERLLSSRPAHVDALERLASLLAAEGNWQAAADAYRRLLPAVERGSDVETLGRIAAATAEACARARSLEAARPALERALGVLSRRPEARPHVERICRATQDWERLADILRERADIAPGDDAALEALLEPSRLLLDEGSAPEAVAEIIERARAANPDHVDALLLWATAQVTLGRANHALLALYEAADKHAGERTTELASIHLAIGKAHLAVDEVVEAFDALHAGFAVDPRTGDVALLLGLVALDLDDEKTAERALSAVTMLPPRRTGPSAGAAAPGASGADGATKAIAYDHLARLALARGDLAKARRLAQKAGAADPDHAGARALLERLDAAATLAPEAPVRATLGEPKGA